MNVALIGAGYWGPNLARVFFELPGCNLHTICDKKKDRLDSIRVSFPNKYKYNPGLQSLTWES